MYIYIILHYKYYCIVLYIYIYIYIYIPTLYAILKMSHIKVKRKDIHKSLLFLESLLQKLYIYIYIYIRGQ